MQDESGGALRVEDAALALAATTDNCTLILLDAEQKLDRVGVGGRRTLC